MAMVTISGKRRRDVFRVKRDIDGFRFTNDKIEAVSNPNMKNESNKLWFNPDANVGESVYLRTGEKIKYNTVTKEVRIE
jgi:hypothetical protein